MRIRRILRGTGRVHLDNGSFYFTYYRENKNYDRNAYLNHMVVRTTNSGDESNGMRKLMPLQEAVKQIENSKYARYYSKRLWSEEYRF